MKIECAIATCEIEKGDAVFYDGKNKVCSFKNLKNKEQKSIGFSFDYGEKGEIIRYQPFNRKKENKND